MTTETTESSFNCPLCHDTGYRLIDFNTAIECECGCLERKQQENKLRFASIPATYENVRLKDFTTKFYSANCKESAKQIAEAVKFWLDNIDDLTKQGKGLYFWSETKGSGKTMLAAALANELINEHKQFVKFATSTDILDAIRNTYNRDSEESESKLLNDLTTAKYLVIDDFGTERVTDWVGEKFYQIINKRYTNQLVTFFTSNCDLDHLNYDKRITNRIFERSFVVHFPEESVREVKARQENVIGGVIREEV